MVVAGQITSNAIIDIEKIVRRKLKEVGYDIAEFNMDYKNCDIKINIIKQSNDIVIGVDIGGAGKTKEYSKTTNYDHFGREEFIWEEVKQI